MNTECLLRRGDWQGNCEYDSRDDADCGGGGDYCVTVRHMAQSGVPSVQAHYCNDIHITVQHGCHTWHRTECQVCRHITVTIFT